MKKMSIISLFISLNTFAHGENMLGPHGGYIRMPGPFHVELVLKENNTFNVFLMNVNNAEPKTIQSFVLLNYKKEKQNINYNCLPKKEFFECTTKEKVDLNYGNIFVKAKRLEAIGDEAKYDLPLELKK